MNTITSAVASKLSSTLHSDRAYLNASSVGTPDMLDSFIRLAGDPKSAHVVVAAFEGKIAAGYTLDRTLSDILNKAKKTVLRNNRVVH